MQANVSVRKPVRFVLLAAVLAGILFLVASHGNVADAKPSAVVYNGHCYRYVASVGTWAAANAAAPTLPSPDSLCAGMTGYLAVINSAAENTFVFGLATGDRWLGGSDAAAEGTWRWVTISGQPIFCIAAGVGNCPAQPGYYTNWAVGDPNNQTGAEHYLEMYGSNGTWNDATGVWTVAGYVVEYDPAAAAPTPVPAKPSEVPEADTLLLLGGGMSGLGVWLRWQWSKRGQRTKSN